MTQESYITKNKFNAKGAFCFPLGIRQKQIKKLEHIKAYEEIV